MSRPHVPGVPVRAGRIGGHREPIDIVRKVVTTLCAMKCEMVSHVDSYRERGANHGFPQLSCKAEWLQLALVSS